jgi:hypothetical protein
VALPPEMLHCCSLLGSPTPRPYVSGNYHNFHLAGYAKHSKHGIGICLVSGAVRGLLCLLHRKSSSKFGAGCIGSVYVPARRV